MIRGRRFARAAVLFGGAVTLLLVFAPNASADPSITGVNPPGPVLAGSTVFVNASGFPATSLVNFHWDGALASDTATSDGSGSIAGASVVVPLSLAPGDHTLDACSPVATCSAGFTVSVGPFISTTASSPVHHGQSISVTVAGLQAGQTAIFGWNGAFQASPSVLIPDMASFTTSLTVPANAPGSSTLSVCEQQSGTTCVTTVATRADLALTVVVPPPPTTPHPTPTPSTTPSTAQSTATATPSATPSVTPSVTPSNSGTPTPLTGPVTPRPPLESIATPSITTPQPPAPGHKPPHPAKTHPLYTPKKLVHLEVAAFSLLALVSGQTMIASIAGLALPGEAALGGLAAAGAGAAAGSSRPRGGSAGSAKVKEIKGVGESDGVGDQSRSWRWPGTARLDALALAAPVRVAPRSPLLARLFIDGSYLRAIFGSLSLVLPVIGLVLGVLALRNTHAIATVPSVGLMGAVAVLSVFDAMAGFVAALVFVGGVFFTLNLNSFVAVRTMIGIGVIWFAVPLIAGAARPLRRRLDNSATAYRQRVGDLVIASLIGAWALQKMVLSLPGLAQRHLPIANDASKLALIVLAASGLRILFETAAALWYPRRLVEVQPAGVPKPSNTHRILVTLFRTLLFLFFAAVFVGNHWQLWVGGLIFVIPQLISIYENKFPNNPRLYTWLPRGLLKLVIMMFVGTAFGIYVLHRLHSKDAALDAFVLLTIPGLVIGAVELFARDGHEPDEGWLRWFAGLVVLVVGVLFVFGYVS